MFNQIIKFLLICLLIFTPIAFGSMDIWAFSLMEIGILAILILWSIQSAIHAIFLKLKHQTSDLSPTPIDASTSQWVNAIPIILFSIFLLLVVIQMIPLPSWFVKIISPKTYEIRHSLLIANTPFEPSTFNFKLSFIPFLTKIEFFKWLTLGGLFFFLLNWQLPNRKIFNGLIPVILLIGIAESLYGMFESFSGHGYILHLSKEGLKPSITGTFINPNYFAGYLLMVIPLSAGYLFSRETLQRGRFMSWRSWLSSLDGKTLLIAFGIMIMIVGLFFSGSRMGIVSLLFAFTLITIFFRSSQRKQQFSKTMILILSLAIFWAAWIGLDAVVSRFFTVSESFEFRWEIWKDTFQIIKDFPLFGTGLGTFILIYPMYQSLHTEKIFTHAENDYLQLASDVGLVGTGLLLLLFLFLIFKAASGIRSLSPTHLERNIGIGGMVGIFSIMLHSIVERNIQVPANAFLYVFLMAMILRINLDKAGD